MIKRWIFIPVVILSLFIFSIAVYAGSSIGEGDKDVAKPCDSTKTGSLCWSHSVRSGADDYVEGIRVSIVDKNSGARIVDPKTGKTTTSIDYARCITDTETSAISALANRTMYQYENKYTKNEALKLSGKGILKKGYNIQCFGDKHVFPAVFNKTGKELKDYFLDLSSLEAPQEKKNFYKAKYLTPIGYNPNNYTAEQIKNHYLLIEPIIYIRVTKIKTWVFEFVGSATEVVNLMTNVKQPGTNVGVYDLFLGGTSKAVPGMPKFSYSANRSHLFRRQIPTMIYVDTDNTRIGGLSGIAKWVTNPNLNLSAEILTTNGTAAGHVWVSPQDCNNLEFAKANPTICCKELYNKHYLKDNKIDINDYLIKGKYYCCEDLAVKITGFKNSSLYKNNCQSPIIPEKCTYKFDAQCPDNCFGTTNGYIKDIGQNNNMQEWKCIFDSPKSSLEKVRNHYKWTEVDNRYCQVFCREEISYQLPGNGFIVEAGHHFTVGGNANNSNWSPIKFTGYIDCRTKGNSSYTVINHKQFVIDWDEANEKVISTYDDWQTEKVRDISREKAVKSTEKDCNWTCDKWYPTYPCENGKGICGGGCEKGSYKSYLYTPPTVTKGDYTATESKWCSDSGAPSSGTPSAERAYERALDDRTQLRDWIFECNTWNRNYKEFQPKVELQYEEDEYRFYFGQKPGGVLKSRLTANNTATTYYSGDKYNVEIPYSEKLINRADCNDDFKYCKTNKQEYPINDNKKYEVQKNYVYSLGDDVYRYVLKPQGYSYHKIPVNGEYVDVGYPNLPVHYSRLPGRYEISLRYTTFGKDVKFDKYVFERVAFPYLTRDYYNCSNIYKCEYLVNNDFMEDYDKDYEKYEKLNVIFRPISLTNPFPGEKGKGRTPCSNWIGNVSIITNNRGLSEPERIYFDTEPMYQIILTPKLMRNIRSYNRNQRGGYGNFTLSCITGTGRECRSSFIRDTYRDYFSGCGIDINWNACS